MIIFVSYSSPQSPPPPRPGLVVDGFELLPSLLLYFSTYRSRLRVDYGGEEAHRLYSSADTGSLIIIITFKVKFLGHKSVNCVA